MVLDKRTKEHDVFLEHVVNGIEIFFFWAVWQAATAK